jgi:hypothetical protein
MDRMKTAIEKEPWPRSSVSRRPKLPTVFSQSSSPDSEEAVESAMHNRVSLSSG